MCGLFGWVGKDPKKFNKDKFNILGIINETRGTDSCGVTVNGEIYFGLKSTSDFRDFIVENNYTLPEKIPTIFGHTRNSSKGAINKDNIHPFGFGNISQSKKKNDNIFEFVGAHNGTLRNEDDLAKKYKIDDVKNKIDSQILLESIYKSKNFKVLSEYIGGAALLFSNLNEPNVIYAYHGESKLYNSSTSTVEERPLFYFKKGKNDLYISSIENSLKAIADTEKELKNIHAFETNIVYKITDGDIDNAKKFTITRNKSYQKDSYTNWSGNTDTHSTRKNTAASSKMGSNSDLFLPSRSSSSKVIKNNIMKEKVYNKNIGGKIYYENLRYKRNGHIIDGVYVYFNNYGFFKVGDNRKEAIDFMITNNKKAFNTNTGYFEKRGVLVNKEDIIPFKRDEKTLNFNIPLFYILDGILLKNELDYEQLKDGLITNFAINQLSHCSEYPICEYNVKSNCSILVYNEGTFSNKIFNPLGSDRIYYCKHGSIEDIEIIKEEEINDIDKLIEENQKSLESDFEKEFKSIFIEDFNNTIDNELLPTIDAFNDDLETYAELDIPIYKTMKGFVSGLIHMSQNMKKQLNKDMTNEFSKN